MPIDKWEIDIDINENPVWKASGLAQHLHLEQKRKSTGGSYFREHLVKVAEIVRIAGGSHEVIAAAYLHDALEDCVSEDCSVEDLEKLIRDQLGEEVLSLIKECTEIGPGGEEKALWIERKRAYLEHIKVVSAGALLISVADKLQSARDDLQPYVEAQGNAFYDIFKKAGSTTLERKANTLWFHRSLIEAFDARWFALMEINQDDLVLDGVFQLIGEFREIVGWLEGN